MNIQINRETLLKPLTAVSSIVEKRHTLPILSNLLIEAKQNKIHLTATDLEMQISLSLESASCSEFSAMPRNRPRADACPARPDLWEEGSPPVHTPCREIAQAAGTEAVPDELGRKGPGVMAHGRSKADLPAL